jgi:hypothetical protein
MLKELSLTPGAQIDLGDWIDTAMHALHLEHEAVGRRMVKLAEAQPAAFERDEDVDVELAELAQWLGLESHIPKAHQRALLEYMLGNEAPLTLLLQSDARASAATHAVLVKEAPLLASFFVVQAPVQAAVRRDRLTLVLGASGIVVALLMLGALFKYGSSWAGPALEAPRRGPPRETAAPSPEAPAVHQSDDVFELRVALLRARPCVCESALAACRAIGDFDRSASPSCALLVDARGELDAALATCGNDEAREVLSRACPTLR